jgi:hippurate hydrolase
MAILVGAARVLGAFRGHWHGTVLFIGQPAEETVSGAKAMIRDGLFSRFPRPGYALALHLGPGISAGDIGFREGAFSAGAESLDLVVRGTGGHAAHPELAKDPVVAAAETVLALQTVVSREVRPGEFAVLTVAAIHGGAKHNAIPDEVALQINLRYYREEVRRLLLEAVPRVAEGIARAAGIPEDRMPLVTVLDESVPPLYNDPGLTQRVMAACRKRLGESHVHEIEPLAGSEDFGIFGIVEPQIPLCYFRIGADPPGGVGQGPYLHSGRFSPDPGAIRTGVAAMVAAVLELLG